MRSGHCRHCDRDKCVSGTHWAFDGYHVEWEDGHCPFCAESDRIALDLARRSAQQEALPPEQRMGSLEAFAVARRVALGKR